MKKLDLFYQTFLRLGLGISLLLAIIAFNYTTYENQVVQREVEYLEDSVLVIIRMLRHEKITPPPPLIESVAAEAQVEDRIFQSDPIQEPQPVEMDSALVVPDSSSINGQLFTDNNADDHVDLPPIVQPVDTTTYLPFQIERMPFPGDCYGLSDEERKICSEQAFKMFLATHVKYPKFASENGISGTVVVRFIVDMEGQLTDFSIVKDPGGGLGSEAIRVFKEMPKWTPGIQNGRPVRVTFNAPVRFILH